MRKAAKVQIGITNGGGLRVPIAAGNITMGNLYEVMPFDNTLVKMNLKGSDLKRAIENGIENNNVGWVQVSGVKVYYDKSATAAPSNNGGVQNENPSQNGGNSSTTNGGSSSIGNSSGNGSSTNTSANNSSSALKPTLADFGVSASTLAKLPQTGSAVDTVLLIEIGAAAVVIGFAMFIAAKKRKKEKDAA